MRFKPRTAVERSKFREQVEHRLKMATPEQKAAFEARRGLARADAAALTREKCTALAVARAAATWPRHSQ